MKFFKNYLFIIFSLAITTNSYGQGTWTPQTSGTSSALDKVYFTDSNNGWVVGKSGLILHTTDGGVTWNSQVSGTTQWLHSVFFIDSNNGWIVGKLGTILRYNGSSWSMISPPSRIRWLRKVTTARTSPSGWRKTC